jgi:hypothetical protein
VPPRKSADFDEIIDDGTVGTELVPPVKVSQTQTVAQVLNEDIGYLRRRVRVLHEDADELHQKSHYTEWNARTSERGRAGVVELLGELSELGFAWRDVARLVGVTVPAIQKWRRGERVTGVNRHKVAGLVAACDLVSEVYGIQDIASWFEMPILAQVPVTPIDLWQAERTDLVFEHACGQADPEQILTEFNVEWRDQYRSDFEVFRASDDRLSVRPKE